MAKVIIFGPTGAVGGAAALEAHRLGAKVFLAMRDVKKATPKLPDLPKFQADLSDPASVKKAVQESGATAAFCYLAHGQDMKKAFEAMMEGGINYVVFLSSWSVYPDVKKAAEGEDYINKTHALAELALESLGLKYTALRPAYFASNIFHQADGIKNGQVYLYKPDKLFDFLAPADIGSVAGAKLLGDPEIIPITGPRLFSQREAFDIVSKAYNKEIKVVEIGAEDFVRSSPMPEFITKSLVSGLNESDEQTYPEARYKQGAGSLKKYTGREPTSFEDFLKTQTEETA